MESLKVKYAGKFYLLYNVSRKSVREFKNDPQLLMSHFHDCLQNGRNIAIPIDEANNSNVISSSSISIAPSTSSSAATGSVPPTFSISNVPSTSSIATTGSVPSTSSILQTADQTFSFLCGNVNKKNFVYAVKIEKFAWHYFEESDTYFHVHGWLPASLETTISSMKSLETIKITLDETAARQYFENGKFTFNNKELNTHMTIVSDNKKRKSDKTTKSLVFISGQTNPLFFLSDFEKCGDVKDEKDKMYKIRNFIDQCHMGEFTDLYFKSNWDAVKSKFLSLYTVPFIQKKKKELSLDFDESITLRSFFENKLTSLSKFTSLPFINQIEIILNDLPTDIAKLFITKQIMTGSKTDILDFCNAIQDTVEHFHGETKDIPDETHQPTGIQSDRMEMEVFDFTPQEKSNVLIRGRGRGRGRGRARGSTGRSSTGSIRQSETGDGTELLPLIAESNESSSDCDFVREMDDTSRSSWSN